MLDNQDTPWHTSASWPRRARDPPLCDVPSRPYAGTDDADELLADLVQMVENVIRHTAERLSRGERRGDWSEMLQGAQKATRGALQQPQHHGFHRHLGIVLLPSRGPLRLTLSLALTVLYQFGNGEHLEIVCGRKLL